MLTEKLIPSLWSFILMGIPLFATAAPSPPAQAIAPASQADVDEGIRFACKPARLRAIESGMDSYLSSLQIGPDLFTKKVDRTRGKLVYTLSTPADDFSTLDLAARAELKIRDDTVSLPAKDGKERRIAAVSRKEIVLALLQHGRLTEFKGSACAVAALQDHVGIRQNTAAWAEELNWVWPDGDDAQWNKAYWNAGTPRPGVALADALNDVFRHAESYSFGCYTSAKIVMLQGVLDYYQRIRKDAARVQQLEQRLYADRDPLANIEPGAMWRFEKDFNTRELKRPGKLVKLAHGIAASNFVPGDWVYFLNTDPVTYEKTGYEGSNPIYLGRNRFADYFNDHDHAYTYEQKMDQVYQWQNGVFSLSRDYAKRIPLSAADIARLGKTPAEGGMVMDFRAYPYFFGYEKLPDSNAADD